MFRNRKFAYTFEIVSKYMISYQDDLDFRNMLLKKIILFVFASNLVFFVFLLLLANNIRLFLKIDSLTPIYIFIFLLKEIERGCNAKNSKESLKRDSFPKEHKCEYRDEAGRGPSYRVDI